MRLANFAKGYTSIERIKNVKNTIYKNYEQHTNQTIKCGVKDEKAMKWQKDGKFVNRICHIISCKWTTAQPPIKLQLVVFTLLFVFRLNNRYNMLFGE